MNLGCLGGIQKIRVDFLDYFKPLPPPLWHSELNVKTPSLYGLSKLTWTCIWVNLYARIYTSFESNLADLTLKKKKFLS